MRQVSLLKAGCGEIRGRWMNRLVETGARGKVIGQGHRPASGIAIHLHNHPRNPAASVVGEYRVFHKSTSTVSTERVRSWSMLRNQSVRWPPLSNHSFRPSKARPSAPSAPGIGIECWMSAHSSQSYTALSCITVRKVIP
jgi:hypothetical protein